MIGPAYVYSAKVLRVLDGDTIECDIDLGFYMTARMPVRLARINAKERNQVGGKAATDHLKVLLGDGNVLLRTSKPRDKYGRYLADVMKRDWCVNDFMVADGFAVYYDGVPREAA